MRLLARSTTGTIWLAKGSKVVLCPCSASELESVSRAILRTSCVPAQQQAAPFGIRNFGTSQGRRQTTSQTDAVPHSVALTWNEGAVWETQHWSVHLRTQVFLEH